MINLKNFKIININNFFLIIILILFLKFVFSVENKIIFKINDNAFTSYDYEKRIRYLEFIGGDKNAKKNIIIEDLISVYLFYEYYKGIEQKKDFKKEINDIYNKIKEENINNNKEYQYEKDKENILFNIKIDLIRKNILEKLLNNQINNINISNQEIDLLYIFNIKYINFESEENYKIKRSINNLEIINFENIINLLKKKNINFFIKEEEVNEINKINNKIKKNISMKNDFFILEKNKKISIIFIEKKFETFEGIVLDLYSVRSKNEISNKDLDCEILVNNKKKQRVVNKEYNLKDLNNELKENLVSINDYVRFSNEDEYIYVVLCNIKFNKEILDNIKLNKIINSNVKIIERNFIKKYSEIFNLLEKNA